MVNSAFRCRRVSYTSTLSKKLGLMRQESSQFSANIGHSFLFRWVFPSHDGTFKPRLNRRNREKYLFAGKKRRQLKDSLRNSVPTLDRTYAIQEQAFLMVLAFKHTRCGDFDINRLSSCLRSVNFSIRKSESHPPAGHGSVLTRLNFTLGTLLQSC